jgi:hypothetical protein
LYFAPFQLQHGMAEGDAQMIPGVRLRQDIRDWVLWTEILVAAKAALTLGGEWGVN